MGGLLSRLALFLGRQKKCRILMVGLDGAGKTTALYRMKLNELVTTVPTVGFNVEMVKFHNIEFTIWDVGGQDKLRPMWRYYGEDAQAIIFLIDSSDADRIDQAAFELRSLLTETGLGSLVVLVLCNKQDIAGAVSVDAITAKLSLHALGVRRSRVVGCSAKDGDGLFDGLEWLASNIANSKPPR